MQAVIPIKGVVVWLMVATVYAEDWIQFRGPTGQGHSTAHDLPVEWTKEKNVVWKQAIPGTGWSSPIVHDGLIYLTTATAGRRGTISLRTLALDAETGKLLGNVEVYASNVSTIHNKNSHASPSPLIDKGNLFVHFGHHAVACLDLQGNILWKNNRILYDPVHGSGGSPILTDKSLIFSVDGAKQTFVMALDRATGRRVWKADRQSRAAKKFSFCTPLLIAVDGTEQVICPGSGSVISIDPATGRHLWHVRYKGYSVIPRPVYGHGMVYVCTGFDSPTLMAIRDDGQGDVTRTHVEWVLRKGVPHSPSPLLVRDELYVISDRGVASCLDAKTGKVHWQKRVGGAHSASPLYADGNIYFQSEEGVCTVIKPGKIFEKIAKNDLGERTLASFAVADSAIFIRTANHLYRIQQHR